jgi:GTPase SAR1 family protein
LTQLPAEIGQLTNLQTLELESNRLTQLPAEIGQLINLYSLYLLDNRLTQLPAEIGQLTNLQELNLESNRLTQLPAEIGQLTNLQKLNLESNRLTQLPAEIGQLTNLQELSLNENSLLLTPPPEIVTQGMHEMLSFLRAIQLESIRRYEAKLLLVGEGGTGKSSLLRALHGRAFDPSLDSTHGIEVEALVLPHPSLPEYSLTLNTWDFGGQDIYHATHQFFLTKRSLYLVVWNARTGDEQSKLDFWLKTISIRAPEAPIILVATHIDERAPELNEQQYRRAYSQIVGILQVSSKTEVGLQDLKETIVQQAAVLPLMGQPWPTSWVEVEQALLARPQHHIDAETYTQLCVSKGVQAEMAQGTLGSYLHDLGKILFFRDDPLLSRMVVLKPNWITKAISHVLEDEPTKEAQGILAHADLTRVWATDEDGQPYDHSLYPAFLRLMERFDLSYQIDQQIPGMLPTNSLVPQLLPYQPPPPVPAWPSPVTVQGQMQIEMIYRFDFVPAGIMSWFIVRTHQYTQHVHWRDGVVLAYRGHSARVELFPSLRELRLIVWGVQPYTFFVILKETLDLILARFEGLHVKREVPCICHRQTHSTTPCQEVYRYEEDLVRRLESGKQTLECPASYEDVSVLELLYGLHVGTAPQVLAKVEEGQQEILRQLSALQRHDELLLQKVSQLCEWQVRSFTRLWNLEMHKMEAECPNTFFLIPGSHTLFNPKNWFSQDYKLYLMCQHPPGPHCVDDEYSYDLRPSREWWVKVSPWLKYLITFLKFGVPMAGAVGMVVDAVDFKNIDAQVKLLEKITVDLPEIMEGKPTSPIEERLHPGQEQTIGPALRFLHSFLEEIDKQRFWGGLQKVITLDGNILWLCSLHARPYEVQPLVLAP